MGSKCQVCRHDKRHLIEIGLVNGIPRRVLAAKYGVSPDAIWRHSKNHLPASARAAILTAQLPTSVDLASLRQSEAEGMLGHLVGQRRG